MNKKTYILVILLLVAVEFAWAESAGTSLVEQEDVLANWQDRVAAIADAEDSEKAMHEAIIYANDHDLFSKHPELLWKLRYDNPDSFTAAVMLADYLRERGDWNNALSELHQYLRRTDFMANCDDLLMALASGYCEMPDMIIAISNEVYHADVDLSSSRACAVLILNWINLKMSQSEEAVPALEDLRQRIQAIKGDNKRKQDFIELLEIEYMILLNAGRNRQIAMLKQFIDGELADFLDISNKEFCVEFLILRLKMAVEDWEEKWLTQILDYLALPMNVGIPERLVNEITELMRTKSKDIDDKYTVFRAQAATACYTRLARGRQMVEQLPAYVDSANVRLNLFSNDCPAGIRDNFDRNVMENYLLIRYFLLKQMLNEDPVIAVALENGTQGGLSADKKEKLTNVLLAMSWCTDKLGLREKTLALQRQAVEVAPYNAECLNAIGYTMCDYGQDLDLALKYIQAAQLLALDNMMIRDSLAWCYYRLGDFKSACREMKVVMDGSLKYPLDVSTEILDHAKVIANAYASERK